jgi:hypothetical protein
MNEIRPVTHIADLTKLPAALAPLSNSRNGVHGAGRAEKGAPASFVTAADPAYLASVGDTTWCDYATDGSGSAQRGRRDARSY